MEDGLRLLGIVYHRIKDINTGYNSLEIFQAANIAINTVHNEEVKAFNIKTKRGESDYCSQCGKCCEKYGIILREEDIKRLEGVVDLTDNIVKENGYFIFANKPCRYQQDDGRCGCYVNRPITCQNHPLTLQGENPRILRDPECDFVINFMVDKTMSILTNKPFK